MVVEKPHISKKEALSLITRYCSIEERCISDTREKLNKYDLSENDIEEIIEFLKKEKYIDEVRYSAAFVNDKFRFNKWGKYKITYSLKRKLIPEAIISKALQNISDKDSKQLLKSELQKKLKCLPKADEHILKGKLYRFAASRGFENDLIINAISEVLNE